MASDIGGKKYAEIRRNLFRKFGRTCAYCGKFNNPMLDNQLQLDHIKPQSIGGLTTADNILPACRKCNIAKSNRNLIEWHISNAKKIKHLQDELELLKRRQTLIEFWISSGLEV